MDSLAQISNTIEDNLPKNGSVSISLYKNTKGEIKIHYSVKTNEHENPPQRTDNLYWALKEIISRLTE